MRFLDDARSSGRRMLDSSCVCSGRHRIVPVTLKPWRLPSASPIVVVNSSSGSAARNRTNGIPRMAVSRTALPAGASMSSVSGSRWKRHTHAPASVSR